MASKKSRRRNAAHTRQLSKKLGYSVEAFRRSQEKRKSRKAIETAKAISSVVPKLKKLTRKTVLTSHQRGLITRYAKKVRHVTNLHPISASKAKKYRNLLFKPGIQAVRLRNTETNAKVFFGNDGMIVTSNGRKWVYWPLDYETASNQKGQLAGAAKKAFNKQFPIERAAKLAETAFKKLPVIAITLWTHAGRADQTFSSIEQFTLWMNDKWQAGRYVRVDDRDGHVVDETNSGAWIVGLAIRVE